MKDDTLVDTHPVDFAWSSPERALLFAQALSEVVVGHAQHEYARSIANDAQRMVDVLHVVRRFSPVKLATLWKLKARARTASIIGRTKDYSDLINPSNHDEQTEFVCSFDDPHLKFILESYWRKIGAAAGASKPKGVVAIDDVSKLPPNGKFMEISRVERFGLKKCLSIPFGSLCLPNHDQEQTPNYLLNLYFSEYPNLPDREKYIPTTALEGVQTKLLSGSCALIDRRLTQITREMSNVSVSDANAGAEYAINKAIRTVLPNQIECKQILMLHDGPHSPLSGAGRERRLSDITPEEGARHLNVPQESLSKLSELISRAYVRKKTAGECDIRREDTVIIPRDDIEAFLPKDEFADAKSLLIGRITSRVDSNHPRGYLILVNRINDLALVSDRNARISDEFDWEDEIYLSHICSILDFIAELFTAEESRLRRVHILAHEMHVPTEFIYTTAERVKDGLAGKRDMPEAMVMRELNDILITSDLQSALIDSLMIVLQNGSVPPRKKFRPEKISLRDIADEVSRMTLPVCRKYGVNHTAIHMRNFPDLYFDRRAAIQVFLNIVSNAIKYSSPNDPRSFSLSAYSEPVTTSELRATYAPKPLLDRLEKLGVERGHLVFFADRGIGVPENFRSRIFTPGARADTQEVAAKTGAGLGLSVVRSIMKDHFGDVWLEQPRTPTVFNLFFPDILETGKYTELSQWRGDALSAGE